ncbi:MAG: cyclic nucleotide-binding domain-containing protein [Tatlockia sp.]|nr:cyclic nucleotide-binding domain-containing protein [Tatlockia sp.]
MDITFIFLISQFILLLSYLMSSMILLRGLVCVSQIGFMIAALMFGLNEPAMLPTFIFAILIFLINIIHIFRLFYVKIPAAIPNKFKNAYQQEFQDFSTREFIILISYTECRSKTNDYIIKEKNVADVSLIINGCAEVLMVSNHITELVKNNIIGEISFLTYRTSIASIKAIKTVNFCTWSRENLHKLKNKYPKIYYKFYDHLLLSFASKLLKQNIRTFV